MLCCSNFSCDLWQWLSEKEITVAIWCVQCTSWCWPCEITLPVGFQLGFLLLALIWQFDFSPFMVLIIAILNDGESPCTLRITIYNNMDSNVHSRIETLYFVELCILDCFVCFLGWNFPWSSIRWKYLKLWCLTAGNFFWVQVQSWLSQKIE